MNALFDRFHNFILPLVRGEDGVCACTCGRHQVYHVVPYNRAQSMVDSRENYVMSDIMTRQEMNVIAGLLLGLCISLFLQWLDSVWHSSLTSWRRNQMNDVAFWSWMPKFSNTREFFRRLHPKHTEDSRRNVLHFNEDIEGTMEREIGWGIGAAVVVLHSLYHTVVMKRELSLKAKLSRYRKIACRVS